MAFTTEQFAASIRTKFPEGTDSTGRSYADISDAELTERIITKHPVYRDQITDFSVSVAETVEAKPTRQEKRAERLEDIQQFEKVSPIGLAKGVAKGVGKTVIGLGKLGTKIGQAVFGRELIEGSPIFDETTEEGQRVAQALRPEGALQKLGFGIEQIAEFFIPEAKLAGALKASKTAKGVGLVKQLKDLGLRKDVVNFIGKAAKAGQGELAVQTIASGVAGAGIEAVRTGADIQEIKEGALIGAIAPASFKVGGKILRGLGNITGRLLKGAAALQTGQKGEIINTLFTAENPQSALAVLRGQRPGVLKESAETIKNDVRKFGKDVSDSFAKMLKDLPKRLGKAPKVETTKGSTTIRVKDADGVSQTFKLSTKGIKDAQTTTLKDFGVKVNPNAKSFSERYDFSESIFDKAETNRLREAAREVWDWKNTTPEGIFTLSRRLKNLKKSEAQTSELNTAIGRMADSTTGYLKKRIPVFAEEMDAFSKAQRRIEFFDQEFATKGKTIGDIAERIKTERKVSALFSGEKTTVAEEFIKGDVVPAGREIIETEAARKIAEKEFTATNVGQNPFADFFRNVTQAIIPPKTVGILVTQAGIKRERAQSIVDALQSIEPESRAAFFNLFAGFDR